MADIVAELRQMYEDSTTDGDRSWVHGDVVNERGCVLFSGRRCIEVGTIFTREDADLIVAMHEALLKLLDIVEAVAMCDPVEHLELANVCLFCEADDLRQYPLTHAPNCPYIRAREMCGKGDD